MNIGRGFAISICIAMLPAVASLQAQPRRHAASHVAQGDSKAVMPAGVPYPVFEFDSVRYFVHPPQGMIPMQTEGRARAVVRVDARGKTTITVDPRSDSRFSNIIGEGLRYVRFRPAQDGGRAVASAVTITAWFMLDRAHGTSVPYADIVLDSANHASGPIERPAKRPGMPLELQPVYNRAELASSILYPDGVPPASEPDTVMVRVLVERNGTVAHAMAEESRHPLLGLAAEEAARSTRFVPAMQSGSPLALWITIPVMFRWKR